MAEPQENLPNWFVNDENNRQEPGGSRKLTGYLPLEPLPAQHLNWLLYSISLWLSWLVNIVRGGTINLSTPYTIQAEDRGKTIVLDSSLGAFSLSLPDPTESEGLKVYIKDVAGLLSLNPVTIERFDTEEIEGLAADYVLEADFGVWALCCDGVGYYFST